MITNNTFCYWDAKSDVDAYILIFNAFLALLICICAIYYARIFRIKYSKTMSNAN